MAWLNTKEQVVGHESATTLVCLDYLKLRPPTGRVLDFGCGDGVLGKKALETAEEVDFWDVKPVRVEVKEPSGQYDLVLANIISGTLVRLAEELKGYTRGDLVLSGIKADEAWRVAKAYEELGEPIQIYRGGWVALCFRRQI